MVHDSFALRFEIQSVDVVLRPLFIAMWRKTNCDLVKSVVVSSGIVVGDVFSFKLTPLRIVKYFPAR